jgi:hypothetical protein
VPTPTIVFVGPIAGQPFRTCLNPRSSLYVDLDSYGYVEEEWFLSGTADAIGIDGQVHAAAQPFTTRCLIRRPTRQASGVTYVEPFHANDEDTPAWTNSWQYLTRSHHTWVGVTTSTGAFSIDGRDPGGIVRLKRTDAERYGRLHLYDSGAPGERMSLDESGYLTDRSTRAAGLLDMQSASILSQISLSVREREPSRRVYAFGFSQTARVWDRFLSSGGRGYDGYIPAVVAPPDARPNGAVVVALLSESELVGTLRPPVGVPDDTDEPRFRGYEVPGSFHYWTVKSTREVDHGSRHSDKPWQVVFHAVLANMELWVDEGIPMPRAPRVERDIDALVRDQDGNAVGGLRTPWLDVPDGRYSGRCSCSPVMGGFEPFSGTEMSRRYGSRYQQMVRRRADQLVSERWLLPEDVEAVVKAAT